ncbi:LysR family transcriptional regulator [Thioclava sp. SK-1]|uniref:LysR family transcriptional regulator n=1 Tax=Thioclava sp. SK-1 TaxID=1889770 RepID=UPI00159F213F|nr:LysR family transcriptional regulator [Thioclava sp. SK-1]
MRGIEAFVAVMASGSMTGAAKHLGIGQPAITRLIRDLEAVLGFAVFERNGPRITPTRNGVQFFEDAQRLMTNYKQVADRAAALRDTRIRSLTIAATPTMAAGLLPIILAGLNIDLPACVSVNTMGAEHLAQAVQSGAVDYGICALPLAHAGVECLVSHRAALVAVVPRDSAVTRVTYQMFAQSRLLTLGNSYRIRHKIDAAFGRAGITPQKELTTNSSLNAILAARAGLGIAIVDPVSALGVAIEGVKTVPLQEDIPYEFGLFHRAGQEVSSTTTQLIEGFAQASQALLPPAGS